MKYTFKNVNIPIYDKKGNPIGEQCIGGYFHPEDNDLEHYKIQLTEYYLVNNGISGDDWFKHDFMDRFFPVNYGGIPHEYVKDESANIGKWSDELDEKGHIYYFVNENKVCKFILTMHEGLSMCNPTGIQYIIDNDGVMVDCLPDEGDILFDDYNEACEYSNKYISKNNILHS